MKVITVEPVGAPAPVEEIEEVFTVVEEPATPVGGLDAFYKWVMKNLKYPNSARKLGVSGKVFVQFWVETDGSISNIEILKSPHKALSKEVERVMKIAPKWNPAKENGRVVRQRMVLPIIVDVK